ncbi:alpha/beta hydrolase [Deinococcus petrolearius]|uniref:Alpha/beta hydrolase n=1 Tax=Deinococcus petrolearius TaxID=1751295 RepID=A0ABW1DKK2_9DEIO
MKLPARTFLFALTTLLAALDPGAARAVPALPPQEQVAPVPEPWQVLGRLDPGERSLLQAPARCRAEACALVVVSHPRAQSPLRLRDSAGVSVLTGELLNAGFAVMLSGDGGPTTWGSPGALEEAARDHAEATRQFFWNGHTYALGLSMGGLLALRSALPGGPYSVQGVALIDGWVNLDAAWRASADRQAEIRAAYGLSTPPLPGLDPLRGLTGRPPLPLFVVSSPDDRLVPQASNADLVYAHAEAGLSEHLRVTGPHLGGNRFTPEVARRLSGFFGAVETRTPPQYGF